MASPFLHAAQRGDAVLVKVNLIDGRARVSKKNANGMTVLLHVVQEGYYTYSAVAS
jgi:hypothetical protein